MFNVRETDLVKLNSLTKYPSIPTYHLLDKRNGGLLEEHLSFAGAVLATEKVDGANSRIICLPDGSYLLGSREELLYARGDLIGNPSLGITDALRPRADEACRPGLTSVLVYYCEVYGGKVTAGSKQYTGERLVGCRLFDVARIDDFEAVLEKPVQAIAQWRDGGGQSFLPEPELQRAAAEAGIELTPRVSEVSAADLPGSVEDGLEFLGKTITRSGCVLDEKAGGRPEGLVVRTPDRSHIAKLRFQDYERTLKRRRKQDKRKER